MIDDAEWDSFAMVRQPQTPDFDLCDNALSDDGKQ